MLKKLQQEHTQKVEDLETQQKELEKKQTADINELNMKLKSKQSLLQLNESTLKKVHDASVLDAIENGLLQGL